MGFLDKFRKNRRKKEPAEEVIENLTHLLNTKESFGAWQKGLGLKSYTCDTSNLASVNKIIADVEKNIEQYEKRIKILDIALVKQPSALVLRLQIDCMIGEKFHSFYLGFKSFPGPDKVEVEDVAKDEN